MSDKNICIIDDHEIVLEGLKNLLLEFYPKQLFLFSSPKKALVSSCLEDSELIILDLSMDEMTGHDFLQELDAKNKYKVLVYTSHGEIWELARLLKTNHVRGIVHKNEMNEELAFAVNTVLDGDNYYSPLISKSIQLLKKGEVNHLAPREKQILERASMGLVAKEVAHQLQISINTVASTHKKICMKLQAKNIVHAVTIAKERGYI